MSADQIPVELLEASGSGIDPHLSPRAAEIQIARVARARGLTPEQVRVNVLEVNLALDALR